MNFHATHYWLNSDGYLKKAEKDIDKELLKLIELNKLVYFFELNADQRLELTNVLKNNEIAQNRLNQIVDNNLESNYDFESLMNYLKKKERKNMINI